MKKDKEYELSCADEFWLRHKGSPFPQVGTGTQVLTQYHSYLGCYVLLQYGNYGAVLTVFLIRVPTFYAGRHLTILQEGGDPDPDLG